MDLYGGIMEFFKVQKVVAKMWLQRKFIGKLWELWNNVRSVNEDVWKKVISFRYLVQSWIIAHVQIQY